MADSPRHDHASRGGALAARGLSLNRRQFLSTFAYSAAGAAALGAAPSRALAAWTRWEPPLQSLLLGTDETPGLEPDEMAEVQGGVALGDPVIAREASGRLWLCWTDLVGDGERILLRSFDPASGEWGELIHVNDGQEASPFGVLAYNAQIAVAGNRLLIVWVAGAPPRGRLMARSFSPGGGLSGASVVSEGRALVRPALTGGRIPAVAWEEEIDGRSAVRVRALDADGAGQGSIIDLSGMPGRDCRRPALALSPDGRLLAYAFDAAGGGGHDVFTGLRSLGPGGIGPAQHRTQVTRHPASDIAPALAFSHDGALLWIGWHSNRAEGDTWDIPRWYRLAAMNTETGGLVAPPTEPAGKDLTMQETIQGWEFVRLVACPDGKVVVIGRPSHNWNMQFYHGREWSPIYRFPRESWGGRGKLAAAVLDDDGALWVTRRDLNANVLQRIGGVVGGEELEPVLVPFDDGEDRPLANIDPRLAFPPERAGEAPAEGEEDTRPELQFYFGDIHAHTWMSDGMGDVDEYFLRSRDVFRDDFAALTDHDLFVGQRVLNSQYEEHKRAVEQHHEDGRFVTLYAQEWTTGRPPRGWGHINLYGTTPDHPLMDHSDPRWDTQAKLMAACRQHGMIAAPHHIGWTGHQWEEHDPEVVRFLEICSVHGVFEKMGNEPIPHRGGIAGMFVQDGLAMGKKFGLAGGSDQHGLIWHHRICWKRNAYRGGLVGVLAPELTREAIFDALRHRRTFATTGVKMRMGFKVNGALMGSEITCEGPPVLEADLIAMQDIRWVDVVRGNEDVLRYGGESLHTFFSFTDEGCPVGRETWYYLRVIFESGDMAWSSPIWVTRRG